VGTYHLQAVVDSVGGSWGREKIQGCSRSNNMRKVVEERSLRVGAGLKNKQFWCCVVSEEQLWSALVPARLGILLGIAARSLWSRRHSSCMGARQKGEASTSAARDSLRVPGEDSSVGSQFAPTERPQFAKASPCWCCAHWATGRHQAQARQSLTETQSGAGPRQGDPALWLAGCTFSLPALSPVNPHC
jgi:hypothetical protein